MKKENGITLVALIITIIILLILATVSISLIINNGILDKAKYGVDKYSEQEELEQLKLILEEYKMQHYLDKTGLEQFLEEKNIEVISKKDDEIKIKYNKYIAKINVNGEITKFGKKEDFWEEAILNYSTKNNFNFTIKTSSNLDANRRGEKVFDNSLWHADGCWHSSSKVPQWFEVAFDKDIILKEIEVTNRTGNLSMSVKKFILQYSDDENTWEDIGEYSIISSENGLKSKFSIPSYTNEGHKYYRLYITESHYDYYVTIGELEIKLLQQ